MWRRVREGPGGVNGFFCATGRGSACGFAFRPAAEDKSPAMPRLIFLLAAVVLTFAGCRKEVPGERGWSARQLAGLVFESPGNFQNTPLDLGLAQEFIESSEMHIAKTADFEIDVLRTVYKTGVELNFDGAAKGAVDGIAHLEGVRNLRDTATELTVSGKPARRLSITAERGRKTMRVEGILIADGQAYYQVQAIFDAASPHAAEDAERLLKSVRLAK